MAVYISSSTWSLSDLQYAAPLAAMALVERVDSSVSVIAAAIFMVYRCLFKERLLFLRSSYDVWSRCFSLEGQTGLF